MKRGLSIKQHEANDEGQRVKPNLTEIRYVKADEIEATLRTVVEQLGASDLSSVQDDISAIKLVLAEILNLLKGFSRTDEMERDLMQMLHDKIQKEK